MVVSQKWATMVILKAREDRDELEQVRPIDVWGYL